MDFNKIKAGNLGAEFFSIWVEPNGNKGHEAKRALDMIDSVYEQARAASRQDDDGLQHRTTFSPRIASTSLPRCWASRAATPSKATFASCATITAWACAT